MFSRQVILQATTTARRAQHKSFLESVPTLEQLTEYEILTIADALVEDSYDDGDIICTQGEVGDAFYIIKKVANLSSVIICVKPIMSVVEDTSQAFPLHTDARAHKRCLRLIKKGVVNNAQLLRTVVFHPRDCCTCQGAASVIQTDALGESQEIAHLDMGHYFGEVR